jgi:hypothetical protein
MALGMSSSTPKPDCGHLSSRRRSPPEQGRAGLPRGSAQLGTANVGYRIINDFSTLVIFSSGASGGNVAR